MRQRASATPAAMEMREFVVDAQLAAASHPGRKHPTNQDFAGVLRLPDGSVLMAVADGVSTAQLSDQAAQLAAMTAVESARAGFALGATDAQKVLEQAVHAANAAVKALPFLPNTPLDEPMTTLVLARVAGAQLDVAWAGDSRLYITGPGRCDFVTRDDSWLMDAVDAGMPLEQASKDRSAHCITQCLGMRDDELLVNLAQVTVPVDALVVACSDGLWNYADPALELSALVARHASTDTALDLSRALVRFANDAGGQDNITVACFRPEVAAQGVKSSV